MNCLPFEEGIARYVDGSLDAGGVRRVVEHLRECPDCATFAEEMEGDRQALRAEPPEIADVDFEGLRAAIRRGIVVRPWPVRWMPALVTAAAILLFLLWRPWGQPGVITVRVVPQAAVHVPDVPVQAPLVAVDSPKVAKHTFRPIRSVSEARPSGSGLPVAAPPQPDPALEAALQDFLAAEKAPPAVPEPSSPVEIRIVSSDANVVLILLQESSGASYE